MTQTDRAARVDIALADPASADAQYCLAAYFREIDHRFSGGFDPGKGGNVPDHDDFLPPRGSLLVAHLDGEAIGCGALRTLSSGVGEIKRMWISPNARGLGLGRRLLAELEAQAVQHAFHTVRLDTNATLDEALALYRSSGYHEIPRFNDNPYAQHWFEKSLR
ncbi:MAG TPA: GNAT family N-acetyltransferase [Rudaea sp.]|jgi:ribosomal protein S18 acetylase RimI-like enzyme|nr:GNAT family N-acetyltransferase [Rudaea sp.]